MIEVELPAVLQAGACTCAECKDACMRKPGWFLPQQIEPLAEAMRLTVQELFNRHLQVDWFENLPPDHDVVYVLSPRLLSERGGAMFPGDPTGECAWYNGGRCAVHKLGKPAECQMLGHPFIKGRHPAVARAWLPFQGWIAELLGRQPEMSEYKPPRALFRDSLVRRLIGGT